MRTRTMTHGSHLAGDAAKAVHRSACKRCWRVDGLASPSLAWYRTRVRASRPTSTASCMLNFTVWVLQASSRPTLAHMQYALVVVFFCSMLTFVCVCVWGGEERIQPRHSSTDRIIALHYRCATMRVCTFSCPKKPCKHIGPSLPPSWFDSAYAFSLSPDLSLDLSLSTSLDLFLSTSLSTFSPRPPHHYICLLV